MQCKNHPERNAVAVCMKYNNGYCLECCESNDSVTGCRCSEPEMYCKFRTQCMVWAITRQKHKREEDTIMTDDKEMQSRTLREEISRLREKLTDRKQALPMHDATPEQWQAVEEIEHAISEKKKLLKALERS